MISFRLIWRGSISVESDNHRLQGFVNISSKSPAFDLLSKILEEPDRVVKEPKLIWLLTNLNFKMPYCLLMNALAKTGQIKEAKSVFDEMLEKCVSSAFCRGGLLEEAKQLAKDFEARYDTYDLVMFNTMLCAYCRAGDMESIMEMLKKMDELAISLDYNTFHILIKYFCKEKLYLLAY
ncbi:pentatricopeptide repeat-containing protein At1g10910, chloroplastic-like [Humulus lupulus]|uniref:pentatricopeptide repeat-containing protein At1g10910, chloroplastic-like n=1 Tax=Humulus lupulus TaxID=3486 RepID=UPI002B411027|nr:pentatricopeptide repeat-containing protein At1g10910, chloroplastic-like [Humulus lupulus]